MAVPLAVAVHADRLCHAEALAAYLARQPDITVVGHASHWDDTEQSCTRLAPDVVVVDVAHYCGHALSRLRRLRHRTPSLRIVLACEHVPESEVSALRATGVVGIVRHRSGLAGVLAALHVARPLSLPIPAQGDLTSRELQVLRLISAGLSGAEAARRLRISTWTVENHKRHIYRKLQVSSREGAVNRATELGLLTREEATVDHAGGTAQGPDLLGMPGEIALTVRELDILTSIARGDSVRQTARSLGIAEKTVENLQSLLFRKLGVRNRTGALATAVAQGLMTSSQAHHDPHGGPT